MWNVPIQIDFHPLAVRALIFTEFTNAEQHHLQMTYTIFSHVGQYML
jgi:hypothetical protein